MTLHQELPDGTKQSHELGPGGYAINPRGTWHTADANEPVVALFISRKRHHAPRTLIFWRPLSISPPVARLWYGSGARCGRVHRWSTKMKYALLIYEDEALYGPGKNGPALQEIVGKHMAFNQQLGAKRIGGSGLGSTHVATTVRTSAGNKTIHDGPYAETKEQLGGFYLIDAADLDEAVEIAKRVPVLQDGAIEIRPLLGG